MHIVITDSGLGGLTICAGIVRALDEAQARPSMRVSYVNAWPEEGRGYNDLPDMAARVAAFDRALAAIDAMRPDVIVIACNTLSIVYEYTSHRVRNSIVPVKGILDVGVSCFAEALETAPDAALVVLGTKTTVASGVYPQRLAAAGVDAGRIGASACHGLATAIERGPSSPRAGELLVECAKGAADAAPAGAPLYLALCCTHYGLVADRLAAAVQQASGRKTIALDPNGALTSVVVRRLLGVSPVGRGEVVVEMVSKVSLPDDMRRGFASIIEGLSVSTARALEDCAHVPDLF